MAVPGIGDERGAHMTAIGIVAVLGAMAAVLAWLHRANARDREALSARLGLAAVPRTPATRGVHPVMGPCFETPLLRGTLDGLDATVLQRTVKRRGLRNPNASAAFVVLRLRVPATTPALRVEPRRTGVMLASLGDEGAPEVATGDAAFDAAFLATAPDARAARAFLDDTVRARLLGLREALAPGLPDSAIGRFAGDLRVGTLELVDGWLDYAAPGTVTPGLVEHLAVAAPVATALARRAGTTLPDGVAG